MFRLTPRRRLGVRGIFAVLAACFAALASAGEPAWLKLEARSFRVISQLDEQETRAWAQDLDQFVGALHDLYAAEQVALPPLTLVLFRQPRDCGP